MKKTRLALTAIALTLLSSSTLIPQQSHAIVGIALTLAGGGSLGIPMLVAGGIAAAGGTSSLIITARDAHCRRNCGATSVFIGGISGTGVGIILLDSENTAPKFAPATEASAAQAGLTSSEAQSYNDELDEINAISNLVGAELAQMSDASVEKSAELWKRYQTRLSPETQTAVTKVVQATLAQ